MDELVWSMKAKREVVNEVGIHAVGIKRNEQKNTFELVPLDEHDQIIERDYDNPLTPRVAPILVTGINAAKRCAKQCCRFAESMHHGMRSWELKG